MSRARAATPPRVPAARLVLSVAALLALAAIGIAVVSPGGARSPAIHPLRVTSGASVATGFALADGRVVTVAHVVRAARALRVRQGPRALRARVLGIDRRTDLALLAVPGVRAPRLEIARARGGSELELIRFRGGARSVEPVHVRRAIVAQLRAPGAERPVRRPALELAAGVRPGDSGAPLVTESGALAGVVFAASRTRANTAYAVDAAALDRLLRR